MSKTKIAFIVINLQTLWLAILTKLGESDSVVVFFMGFVIADLVACAFYHMDSYGD